MIKDRSRILYLTYDGLTDPLGQSQILPYLCGLSTQFSITIISFEKAHRYEKNKILILNICQKAKIEWLAEVYHKHPPVISTLYDIFLLKRKAIQAQKKVRFHIVHCRSYLTSIVGLYLKRKYGVRFIFDMRGFWADERVEGGLWNLSNPIFKIIYNYFKSLEKSFLREADYVVSLTNNAKKEIISWNLGDIKIVVIPTCVDLDFFNRKILVTSKLVKIRDQCAFEQDDFIVLYLGSWGTWYLTDAMLDFFKKVKLAIKKAKFLVVSLDSIDLNNFKFKEDVKIVQAPRELVPYYIAMANLAVLFIKPSFSKKASSATKMAEIMAMDVPVVTNKGWGDAEEIINKAGGYLYSLEDIEFSSNFVNKTNLNTREYCANNLSLEIGIERYFTIYNALLTP